MLTACALLVTALCGWASVHGKDISDISFDTSRPAVFIKYLNPQSVERLDDNQRTAFAETLRRGLPAGVWSRMPLARVQRMRQAGQRLGITEAERAGWLSDWITVGDGWKRDCPFNLVIALHKMDIDEGLYDYMLARTAVIDHLLSQSQLDPHYLDNVVPGRFARFVVYYAQALRLDPRGGDEQWVAGSLAAMLNAVGEEAADGIILPRHRKTSIKSFRWAWYESYQLQSCGGSPGWGEGNSPETDWIGRQLYEGIVVDRIEPRPATLYLLTSHLAGLGELDAWKAFLESRIASIELAEHRSGTINPLSSDETTNSRGNGLDTRSLGTDSRTAWLLARAYAEEITPVAPDPLAGRFWLEQAIGETGSHETRLRLVRMLAAKMAVAGKFAQADALVSAWDKQLAGEQEKQALNRTRETIRAIEPMPQRPLSKTNFTSTNARQFSDTNPR